MINFWNNKSQQHQDDHFAYLYKLRDNEKERSDLYSWAEYVWGNVAHLDAGPVDKVTKLEPHDMERIVKSVFLSRDYIKNM